MILFAVTMLSTLFAFSLCSKPIPEDDDDEANNNKIRDGIETQELEVQVDVTDLGLFQNNPDKYILEKACPLSEEDDEIKPDLDLEGSNAAFSEEEEREEEIYSDDA